MKNTNFLANIFSYIHEVISEADKPISLVVMVLLPFISPLLPALITADSLQKYMQFDPSWSWISVISFEMIGYLGMISLVSAMMSLSKNKDVNLTNALTWNRNFYVWAYVIYLITLLTANIILEMVNGVPLSHVAVIFCLTIGLSISAGILNASRIHERNQETKSNTLRQERREDKLKLKALESGINIFESNVPGVPAVPNQRREKHASDYKIEIITMLEKEYAATGKVLAPRDITAKLKLDHDRSKGYVSSTTTNWLAEKGIQRPPKNTGTPFGY